MTLYAVAIDSVVLLSMIRVSGTRCHLTRCKKRKKFALVRQRAMMVKFVCPGTCHHFFVCRFADRQGTICLAGSQACIDSRFLFLRAVALLCDPSAIGGLLRFDGDF